MTKTELKPCPFCGGKATLGRDLPSENWAYCKDCGVATRLFNTPQDAAEAWNGRAETAVAYEPASYSCRACQSGTHERENELHGKIGKLEAENKRLHEALAFYADLDGNSIQLYGDMESKALEFIDGESQPFGKIARDALKGGKE